MCINTKKTKIFQIIILLYFNTKIYLMNKILNLKCLKCGMTKGINAKVVSLKEEIFDLIEKND